MTRAGARQRSMSRCRVAVVVLLLGWLLPARADALKPCNPDFIAGQAVIGGDCKWSIQQQHSAAGAVVIKGARSSGIVPALTLSQDMQPGPVADGFHLTLKRLVLRNMSLTPISGASAGPRMLPLGLFAATPAILTMLDVRLVVDDNEFKGFLNFFSKQLRATAAVNGSGPGMLTDSSTFINIPFWSDNTTEVFSLVIVGGPCFPSDSSSQPLTGMVQRMPSLPGCNLRSVDNTTLVPTLIRDAAIATTQPLLVRLISNATLARGLPPISIRRPVLLLGMASATTSVDLGMVVNQINVTAGGQLMWQSLVLENLAPGDSTSSLVAAPFSTTVTSNVWAVFCNRSRSGFPCLTLSNVTLVVPSQEEVNYQVFMYTMFNSPAPALREMTEFYRTDLHTSTIQFVSGPGNDSLTMVRLVNKGWDFWYVISTLRSFVAPKRPLPRQAFDMQKYKTGALVQALQECDSFMSALSSRSTSTRTRVWTLIGNVSIADRGHMQCAWPDGNITYPIQLLGQVVRTHTSAQHTPLSPEEIALGRTASTSSQAQHYAGAGDGDLGSAEGAALGPPLSELYALSFGYVPNLFQLSADAQDKYLQIQNTTLLQLPQGAPASTKGLQGRRLLQQPRPSPGPDSTPIGIWTILLWPIKRAMAGAPVTVTDSQISLPQPEWDVLAAEAQQAQSFALQLQGQSGGLTFTGVSLLDKKVLRVGSFQGPGITGTNLWLFPDPAAASMAGYTWPSELFSAAYAASSSSGGSGHGRSVALQAGIGVAVGVLSVLALALVVLVLRMRRRHAQQTAAAEGKPDLSAGPPQGSGKQGNMCVGPVAMHKQQAVVCASHHTRCAGGADVIEAHDTIGQLPGGQGAAACAAAAAAAGVRAGAAKGQGCNSRRSSNDSRCDSVESAASRPSTYNMAAVSVASAGSDSGSACTSTVENVQDGPKQDSSSPAPSVPSVEQTIADGLQRWNAAVSMTTLQLMQRRLQSNNPLYSHAASSATSGSTAVTSAVSQHQHQHGLTPPASPGAAGGPQRGAEDDQGLQLYNVIGTGSFGSVYLGSWRGKRVAVKVMHLNSNALLPSEALPGLNPEEQERRQRQRQQNSPPHMAIMEAVVSSTMSHPNVVQVFTYMLSPLVVQPGAQPGHAAAAQQQLQHQQAECRADRHDGVFGWQLRLVMEYCEKGTLREALDKRRLPRLHGTSFTHPAVAYSLSHDVAAAMLHLHSEGIVHGDLKAGNVLLTANPTGGRSGGCGSDPCNSAEVWAAAGGQPLSAKCADFGMAMPLGPQDTHATMAARGTPTHMSPELFVAGHVSKASDVYAFGILLYEIVTSSRAFAGVPIPLLPHEVAMQGLRPEWPKGVPVGSQGLRNLAEACWVHNPQARPTFDQVLRTLECSCNLPDGDTGQQQQQLPQQQQHHLPPQQPATGCDAGGGQVQQPVVAVCKCSKDQMQQMSWSEVNYGGSKHDGGWA